MPITIDHEDIRSALSKFKLKHNEYYLLFDNNAVYMVWCAKINDVPCLGSNSECLDVEIKGSWTPYEDIEFKDLTPLFCARYILATN